MYRVSRLCRWVRVCAQMMSFIPIAYRDSLGVCVCVCVCVSPRGQADHRPPPSPRGLVGAGDAVYHSLVREADVVYTAYRACLGGRACLTCVCVCVSPRGKVGAADVVWLASLVCVFVCVCVCVRVCVSRLEVRSVPLMSSACDANSTAARLRRRARVRGTHPSHTSESSHAPETYIRRNQELVPRG